MNKKGGFSTLPPKVILGGCKPKNRIGIKKTKIKSVGQPILNQFYNCWIGILSRTSLNKIKVIIFIWPLKPIPLVTMMFGILLLSLFFAQSKAGVGNTVVAT